MIKNSFVKKMYNYMVKSPTKELLNGFVEKELNIHREKNHWQNNC
jgi:hypothetical protein